VGFNALFILMEITEITESLYEIRDTIGEVSRSTIKAMIDEIINSL